MKFLSSSTWGCVLLAELVLRMSAMAYGGFYLKIQPKPQCFCLITQLGNKFLGPRERICHGLTLNF